MRLIPIIIKKATKSEGEEEAETVCGTCDIMASKMSP